ncbi:hypothetical protein AVEN_12202-1 [Araneus ventricosus]|uniref:Uncharacterized protein n=1 Tax=Araneus ventricosus TaxID=182803 RepID=A0A4Y2W5M0_ARAVE|nr:hypothetical protein AVEN_12202-1 [Araneus ventricosus]
MAVSSVYRLSVMSFCIRMSFITHRKIIGPKSPPWYSCINFPWCGISAVYTNRKLPVLEIRINSGYDVMGKIIGNEFVNEPLSKALPISRKIANVISFEALPPILYSVTRRS